MRFIKIAKIFVIFFFCLIIGRLIQIQIIEASSLRQKGLASRIISDIKPAKRGDILSSDGTVLASTTRRWVLQANQREVTNYKQKNSNGKIIAKGPNGAAKNIHKLIGKSLKSTVDILTGNKLYVPLADDITDAKWEKIKKLNIPGIFETPYYIRTYPDNSLAGNIIGYPFKVQGIKGMEDDDNIHFHYAGVDGYEDKLLAGTDGAQKIEVGGNGAAIPGGYETGTDKIDGCSITLSINSDIQFKAQNELNAQVKRVGATSGTLVMLDIKTGKVVAMADSNSINPNNPTKTPAEDRGSRAVSNVFEPGSTGKVVTISEIIEEQLHSPTSKFSVPAKIHFRGEDYKDHDEHGTAKWTLDGILANSSNVGTILAGQKLSSKTRYKYLKNFGFGEKTGIEMPSEAAGILHKPGSDGWDNRTKEAVLFGQGVSVNAIQAVSVYQTLGNKGVKISPRLVEGYKCPGKQYVQKKSPKGTSVVSKKTAKKLIRMMESVVDEGTGKTAKIPNYRVAGKTGTSELITSNGTTFLASFIGLAPADNPRYAMGVFINNPKGVSWGATNAAPVFQKVMKFALQTEKVPPSRKRAKLYPTKW